MTWNLPSGATLRIVLVRPYIVRLINGRSSHRC